MKRRFATILVGTTIGLALAFLAAWQLSRLEGAGPVATRTGASVGGP